jgi:hypothetical protein
MTHNAETRLSQQAYPPSPTVWRYLFWSSSHCSIRVYIWLELPFNVDEVWHIHLLVVGPAHVQGQDGHPVAPQQTDVPLHLP